MNWEDLHARPSKESLFELDTNLNVMFCPDNNTTVEFHSDS